MIDLRRSGRVRDPSHGYVTFTGLERAILDHPVAQRLRHISQSGMAQLVFPEVRSSRFAHSLGAMHLASRFLASALHNADNAVRGDIEDRMTAAISALWRMGLNREVRGQVEADLGRQGLRAGAAVSNENRAYALLIEQGLRLAALFHDLGHLPFSHDFEYALDTAVRKHVQEGGQSLPTLALVGRLAIHETIGYKLATLLEHDIFSKLQPPQWVETTFLLAEKILNTHAELDPDREPGLGGPANRVEGLFQWLHSFVASELDVDRCDYILRDTRHYGLEFVSFDLDRLVDHVVACRAATVPDALFNAVLPQGQSALESFVIARYRMYQWGIFHHKVQQAAAALQKSTRAILVEALRDHRHQVATFLADLEAISASGNADRFLEEHPDVLDRFAGYDDVWWTSVLRQQARDYPDNPWLQLVCRRKPGPCSLWKRRLDFPPSLEDFNRALPRPSDDEQEIAWQREVDQLEEQGVLVLRHRFQPWKSRNATSTGPSALSIRQSDGRTIALSELSYLIQGLHESWMNEVQVHAFSQREEEVSPEEVVKRLMQTTATEAT